MESIILFLLNFSSGFLLGAFVMFLVNIYGMAKYIKRGDMYIKRHGKWQPFNPFREREK